MLRHMSGPGCHSVGGVLGSRESREGKQPWEWGASLVRDGVLPVSSILVWFWNATQSFSASPCHHCCIFSQAFSLVALAFLPPVSLWNSVISTGFWLEDTVTPQTVLINWPPGSPRSSLYSRTCPFDCAPPIPGSWPALWGHRGRCEVFCLPHPCPN